MRKILTVWFFFNGVVKFYFPFYQCNKEDDCKKSRIISSTVSLQGLQLQVRADQGGHLCARTPDPLHPVSGAIPPFTLSTDPKSIDSPLREKTYLFRG
jgi:hypothetical protein